MARQEVASAAAAGALYVVGGIDAQRRSSSDFLINQGASWVRGDDYPVRVDHAAAAAIGATLYVAGGFTDGRARSDAYSYSGHGWTPLAALRHARGALALVAANGRLYALGGNAAGDIAPVEVYDPGTGTWTDTAVLPVPRNHVAGFAWHGLACVAGGRFPTSARVECLDPATGAWSRLPDLPRPTSGAGAVATADEIVVAGGENASEVGLVDQVARFRDGAWTAELMETPRHGIGLALFGGRAWACGGATAPGYDAAATCTSLAISP